MESALFGFDLLTDHEPGIPGGETPPSTAGGTPAATDVWFMESHLFKNDLLTAHEPGRIPGGRDAPLYGRRDARRYGRETRAETGYGATVRL